MRITIISVNAGNRSPRLSISSGDTTRYNIRKENVTNRVEFETILLQATCLHSIGE